MVFPLEGVEIFADALKRLAMAHGGLSLDINPPHFGKFLPDTISHIGYDAGVTYRRFVRFHADA